MTDQGTLIKLRKILFEKFAEQGLRTLCFDLGIDYDGLPGEGKNGKARELIAYLDRRDRVYDLVKVGRLLRPDISWPDIYGVTGVQRARLWWKSQHSWTRVALILVVIIFVVFGLLNGTLPSIIQNLLTTPTPTNTPTPTPTPTLTNTPTSTPMPTPTSTFTPTSNPTPTPTSTSTPTSTPTPTPPDAVVLVDAVNLRSGPGTMYPVIGVLNEGQVLTVTGRSDSETSWLQITTDQGQEGWVINREDLVALNLSPGQIPIVPHPPTPTPDPPSLEGKVCQIRTGQDKNTIFVRQAEFDSLELPIGTWIAVTIRNTGKTVYIPLGLDSGLTECVVRLPASFRNAMGISGDTDIDLENRPIRSFDVTQASPPNGASINLWGKVCMIRSGQDTNTIFLRQPEFNAFGNPAGTKVNVTVIDTGMTVENVTLGLDSGLDTCVVRLANRLREALEVGNDADLDLADRPIRHFFVSKP